MKTAMRNLPRAGLCLLVTLGLTLSAAAQTPEDLPILLRAPAEVQTSSRPPRYTSVQQILSMDADGSNIQQLTDASKGGATRPSWSPDYRYIAFVRCGMLMVMESIGESNGGRVFAVCPAWASGHEWARDGLSLLFCGSSDIGPGLWEVYVDPDTEEVGTPQLLREGSCYEPSWSPDGTRIAFHYEGKVKVFDLSSGTEISFGRSSISPTWNAAGDLLAFGGVVCETTTKGKKTTTECYYEICIATPDLTQWARVTHLKSFCAYPAWSPDGTQLVFRSDVDDKLGTSLYGITSGSDVVTLLCEGGTFPNWAP